MSSYPHVPTARVLSNWEDEGRDPGLSSKPVLGRSKADLPAEKATILTEGWLKRVSTEPFPETEFEGGRVGAGWKDVGTVECRRGAGKGTLSPGGRSWSMIMGSVMAWEAVEDGKVLSDNHVYSRRGAAIVDMARWEGVWRGWASRITRPRYWSQIGGESVHQEALETRVERCCELTPQAAAMTRPELQEMRLCSARGTEGVSDWIEVKS